MLLWRCLGDEVAVYNEGSGQTHVFDAFSEWTLREIEDVPATDDQMVDRLVREAKLDKNLARQRLNEVLAEFDRQGLVEPGENST